MQLYQEFSLGGITFMALILVYLFMIAVRGYPAQPWVWKAFHDHRRRSRS